MYKPVSGVLDLEVIVFIFLTKKGKYLLELASPGGAGRNKTLGQQTFNELKVTLPALPEQQKISGFLSAVDKKIEQLTRKKELLEKYKKGMMQRLFAGGKKSSYELGVMSGEFVTPLRFKDENGNDYPDWEEKRLERIVKEYRLGGNYSNSEEETDHPLIKMGNISRGKINLKKIEFISADEQVDPKDKIKIGDLFFNTRNTLELVGKVAIWKGELSQAYYNSNLMLLKFDNNSFMNYRLNSHEGVKALKRFATGTTSVAAIYTKDLLKLKLAIPSLEEQNIIAKILSNIDNKIDSVINQISQNQQFKKGLLQQMFV
jgi:type I restriction enzyme S subunit